MADITTTEIFTTGQQNINAAELNGIIAEASINATFVSDKSSVTPDPAADYVLGWDATDSALKKFLAGNLLSITSQTDLAAIPALDDYAIVYDTSGAANRKVTHANLVPVDDSTLTRDGTTRQLKIKDGGVAAAQLASNAVITAKILDSNVTTTKIADGNVTAAKLDSNFIDDAAITAATPAVGDFLIFGDITDSGNTKKATIADTLATGRFTSSEQTLTSAATVVTLAHSIGAVPKNIRAVLVCKTIDNGWQVGDEIEVRSVWSSNLTTFESVLWSVGADATNVTVAKRASLGTDYMLNKSTGVVGSITWSRWKLKVYAQ